VPNKQAVFCCSPASLLHVQLRYRTQLKFRSHVAYWANNRSLLRRLHFQYVRFQCWLQLHCWVMCWTAAHFAANENQRQACRRSSTIIYSYVICTCRLVPVTLLNQRTDALPNQRFITLLSGNILQNLQGLKIRTPLPQLTRNWLRLLIWANALWTNWGQPSLKSATHKLD